MKLHTGFAWKEKGLKQSKTLLNVIFITKDILYAHSRRSLKFFRGETYELLQEELDEIINAHAYRGASTDMVSVLSIMGSLVFLKPFSAAMIIILFKVSGFTVVSHYTATYLEKAEINLEPLLGSINIGAVRSLASLGAIIVLSVISKKTTYVTFGLISTLSMMSGKWQTTEKGCYTNHSSIL